MGHCKTAALSVCFLHQICRLDLGMKVECRASMSILYLSCYSSALLFKHSADWHRCVEFAKPQRHMNDFNSFHLWPFRNHTVCRVQGPVFANMPLLLGSNGKFLLCPCLLQSGHMEAALGTGLPRTGTLTVESTPVLTSSKRTAWLCSLTILNPKRQRSHRNPRIHNQD